MTDLSRIAQATEDAERSRTEQSLLEDQEHFRRYFDLGLIGMAMTSPTRGILEVNDEICRILGYERSELLQKKWSEITHPDDLAADSEQFNRVMTGEIDGYTIDKRWVRKDGQIIDSIMSAKCARRSDGAVDYFVGLVQDTTERKRAEAALRRSEAYLAEGQRLSHTVSLAWNVTTEEVYWSVELFRIYGLDPEETEPGYPEVLNYIHADDRARVQKTFEHAVREEKEYELAYRIVRSDGTIRYVNNLAHPVFDEAGTLIEYVGTTIDTTERIRAEEKLRRSEANLADGQRLSHTGSWAWNVATGECFWSLEHFRIFGMDPETFEPTVANTQPLLHPDDLPAVRQTLEQAIHDRGDFEVEYRMNHPDGSIRYHHGLGHPVARETGELEFIGTVMDITERKRTEEELRKTQHELARVSRVTTLGELTASIAHEVNQPLGAIVTNGYACLRLLSRDEPDLNEARDGIESMIRESLRASEVIKRIRALVKKSSQGKSSLNINDTIREVIAFIGGELDRNQIKLQMKLRDDLPLVIGNRVELQQVVLNLILNGSEAMTSPGWQTRDLLITSEEIQSGEAMVAVSDTGIGLEPESLDRVFDPFFTSKEDGLGLGLSISKTIIEAHGGRLWATQNTSGPGATFRFTLPTGDNS